MQNEKDLVLTTLCALVLVGGTFSLLEATLLDFLPEGFVWTTAPGRHLPDEAVDSVTDV
jgi:hypothetical protein